jgi:nucleoside-diphosphate-sugar epimerase
VRHEPARPEDPQQRRPDIALARSLGWEPRTTLRTGLARTYSWLRHESLLYA